MKRTTLSMAVAAALGGSATALAPQLAGAQEAGGLEEIVVTATRREQDLQEVPVSIVAITGDNLELQGLDSLEDVGNYIPNINIQGGGAGTFGTQFRVRGLPNIGMFIDGVWQVSTTGFLIQELVDVDRIEVLRGPQGTTYGRDAVGGAIRIWTRQPGEEFGGSVTATTGSNDRRDAKLSLDVPLSDNFRTKWTASNLDRGGYIQGLTIDHQFGDIDQSVYRGDMVWTPSDTVDIRLVHSEEESWFTEPRIQNGIWDTALIPGPGGGVPAVQTWGVIPAQFYGLAVEGAAKRGVTLDLDPFDAEHFEAGYPGGVVGKWENRSNATLPSHIRRAQTSLDINWDITDNISVQSLTATAQVRSDINVDWENSDYVLVEDIIRGDLEVFSEEIQISGGTDRVSWVAGLYYWDQESVNRNARLTLDEFRTLQGEEKPELLLSDVFNSDRCLMHAPADTPVVAPFFRTQRVGNQGLVTCQWVAAFTMQAFAYDRLQYSQQDGWAVFGEATIALTDRLDLTLGIRQHDQSEQSGNLCHIPGVTAPKLKTGNRLHTGGDPFAGELRAGDDDCPVELGPDQDVSFDQDTYKAALQMQFNDNVMGYFSYSEGFDSGGVDSAQVGGAGGINLYFPYDPQIIENTEIGIRADLMDGLLRVNATYFNSDWLNIQNAGVVRTPEGDELTSLATQNVGEARADGLELEITVVPTDALMLNFNLGLLDTGYTYVAPGVPRQDISLDTEFQQAPDLTYNIGLQYDASLTNGGSVTTRIDYAYSDKFWRSLNFLRMDWYGPKNGGPVPAGIDESGDWGVLNARVTYTPAAGNWRMSVFGTNLTNEYMLNSGFFHGIWGYNFATVSRPREAGISLTVDF